MKLLDDDLTSNEELFETIKSKKRKERYNQRKEDVDGHGR